MKLIKILSIGKFILAVYYTSSDCYQYSIIDDYGTVLEPDELCYTSEAAEQEGREAINTVSRDAIAIRGGQYTACFFSCWKTYSKTTTRSFYIDIYIVYYILSYVVGFITVIFCYHKMMTK